MDNKENITPPEQQQSAPEPSANLCLADLCTEVLPEGGLFCKKHYALIPFRLRGAIKALSGNRNNPQFMQAITTAVELIHRQENREKEPLQPVHFMKDGLSHNIEVPQIDLIVRRMKK